MGVKKRNGVWTYEGTQDCFGDYKTSMYYWPTKEGAESAERNMLLNAVNTLAFNEGLISADHLQELIKSRPTKPSNQSKGDQS